MSRLLKLSSILLLASLSMGMLTPPNRTGIVGKNWGLEAVHLTRCDDCKQNVVVAVIDSGLDYSHPMFAGKVVPGYDFRYARQDAFDLYGHGTHVAGIVVQIASRAQIMPVAYYSEANPGSVNLKNSVESIEFAVAHGARIINYSGGGPEFSEDEYLAIKKAEAKGVLFVAAAGNEHQDSDLIENYYYPAAYRASNVIAVASLDINNNLVRSSNWGVNKVALAAPGENIYSSLPSGRHGYMTGTSQATAFVTGVAANILSVNPSLTPTQVIDILRASVDKVACLDKKVASGGMLNAQTAMELARKTLQAPQVPAFSAVKSGHGSRSKRSQ